MMGVDEQQRVALAARSYLWDLFRLILGEEPNGERLGLIDTALASEAFAITGCPEADELVSALEELGEEDIARLKAFYTKLFIGPGKLAAPPWESVYVTGESGLLQDCTFDVRNAYRVQGLLPGEYPRVADDHIALECAFLASLAQRAQVACDEDDEQSFHAALTASSAFLHDHLGRWSGAYAVDISAASDDPIYPAATRALAQFAASDEALLKDLLG